MDPAQRSFGARGGSNLIGDPGEIILPMRALKQPCPEIHKGGDCGACCLGGALGFSVERVYADFDSDGITQIGEMARCLRCSPADRIIDTPCEWPWTRHFGDFGWPAKFESIPWFNYVRMAIDAGYYGLCMVDFKKQGGPEANHWVLLCGARTEGCVIGKTITGEVLASCSVTGETWYEAAWFLEKMGGYRVLFVRPRKW